MQTPIVEGLRRYMEEKNARFHMPGHKGKNNYFNWEDLIPYIDVTEVNGTDNLHNPSGIIKRSEELAAITFGAKQTLFSVSGTTSGIYSAILSSTKPGDKILIQRNCHKSVYNALIFGRLNPVYIYPEYSYKDNVLGGVDPELVDKYLLEDNEIKAVVITYPTYYGICSDIIKLSQIVHKHNKILIVDEAHGSHLKFSNKLPISALEAGADIVVQSTHKTLPAFTQSSMVHVGSDKVDIERLKLYMTMFQSTSPSYILMASLDVARAYMDKYGEENINIHINRIKKITDYLRGIKGVKVFDIENINNNNNFFAFDTTKILFSLIDLNISGTKLDEILRSRYNIQIEMADYYYGLAITTILDDEKDLEKLAYSLEDVAKNTKIEEVKNLNIRFENVNPVSELKPYEAFEREKLKVNLEISENKICGDFIIPYPPGIPIICPGEIITKDIIDYINFLKVNNIEILGLDGNDKSKIKILK